MTAEHAHDDHLYADLVAYAQRRGLQPADAQDVAAETVVRRLEQPTPITDSGVRPWCFRVAGNLILKRRRDAQRRDGQQSLLAPLLDDAAPDPADTHDLAESIMLAAQAMRGLNPRQQQLVHLMEIEERSHAETAEILGLTRPALRQLRRESMKALRREYLQIGGTVAGFAVLFPMLRAGNRLRAVAAGSALPILTGAMIVVGVTNMPFGQAEQRTPVPLRNAVAQDPGTQEGRADRLTLGLRAVTLNAALPIASDGSRHAGKKTLLPVAECDDPNKPKGPAGLYVCHQHRDTKDPDVYAVGVDLPFSVCEPTGKIGCTHGPVLTQDVVDPTALCPVVTTVPYAICQKGF